MTLYNQGDCILPRSGGYYELSRHCFLAPVGKSLILLNVAADEYVLIEPGVVPTVLSLLSAEPTADLGGISTLDRNSMDMVQVLEDSGAITRDRRNGKPVSFLRHFPSSAEVPGPPIGERPSVRLLCTARVATALAAACAILKFRGLGAAISYVRNLRSSVRSCHGNEASVSDIVEQYNRVKPIFLAAKDNCLLNSLSMIIFLSEFGYVPFWCFGVSLRPFSAHCWVEDEQWLYNDQYQRTHSYVPIMRV